MKIGLIDRLLAAVNPQAATKRVMARLAFDRLREFRYEGARPSRFRQNSFAPTDNPNSAGYQSDRLRLIQQARDLDENDPLVNSLLSKRALYIAGDFRYSARTGDINVDAIYEDYIAERMNACDVSGRWRFPELLQAVQRSVDRDGDILLVRVKTSEGMKLQAVEADLIGGPFESKVGEDYAGGVWFDPTTLRPLAFDIYRRKMNGWDSEPVRVDAANCIHVFDPTRVTQLRGVSRLASVVSIARDLKETLDNERFAVKLLSTVTAVVKTELGIEADPGNIFSENVMDQGGERERKIETFEPGRNYYLNPNESAEAFKVDRPSPAFQGLVESYIRMICLPLGIPYSVGYQMTGTGPGVRMDVQLFMREVKRCQQILTTRVVKPVIAQWLSEGIESGQIPAHKYWSAMRISYGARPTVDIGRETNAAIAAVQAGMMSLSSWFDENGEDYIEEIDQIRKERAMINSLATKGEWIQPLDSLTQEANHAS